MRVKNWHRHWKWLLLVSLVVYGACKTTPEQAGSTQLLDETEGGQNAGFPEFDPQWRSHGSYPIWAYDPGPNPNDPMGKELIDLHAAIPSFPAVSEEVYGSQWFRPVYGPISWRMLQKKNSIKILFIGQDGTHIAEAAGRPATAGFGGRAMDLAGHFGVNSSAAFINAYAFTIKYQYSNYGVPFIYEGNSKQLNYGNVTNNQVWLMSQDQDSPIVKWRNGLIDWIIRNNRDSLKLIVLFGGGARDTMGSYVVSKGAEVGARNSVDDLARIRVPEYGLAYAGGNKQSPYPYDTRGRDLYYRYNNNSAVDHKNPEAVKVVQDALKAAFDANPDEVASQLIISGKGVNGSGLIHPAQIGGYRMADRMSINGQQTISLKGLRISEDLTINHDVLVAQLPHPTYLSMLEGAEASEAVGSSIAAFDAYKEAGWKIEADPGFENRYDRGMPYEYRRGDMGPETYDFGAPLSRMVNVSTASRQGADTIVFGTRDNVRFDSRLLEVARNARPSDFPSRNDQWISRHQDPSIRYEFDPGPGEKWAKIMKTSLPRDPEFLRHHRTNGDFGHYRGTFENPEVIIIADPHGHDDLITARALTGARGQYLHGMMQDLGVGNNYLVIKTAPYSYFNDQDWQRDFEATKPYRDALFTALKESTSPKIVIADGEFAKQEMERLYAGTDVKTAYIIRQGDDPKSGISQAFRFIQRANNAWRNARYSGNAKDIPRAHMSYYARVWEGTSGDNVFTSTDPEYVGKAFAEVAPKWAYQQEYPVDSATRAAISTLKGKVEELGLRRGDESVTSYVRRIGFRNVGDND